MRDGIRTDVLTLITFLPLSMLRQFEAVFMLSSLASQKVAVPRLIAARVHMLVLNLLPPAPVGSGPVSFAIRTMGTGSIDSEADKVSISATTGGDTARGRSASTSAPTGADKKLVRPFPWHAERHFSNLFALASVA